MKRVPSLEVKCRSWDPAAPPEIGGIGGKESSSTHMFKISRQKGFHPRIADTDRAIQWRRPPRRPPRRSTTLHPSHFVASRAHLDYHATRPMRVTICLKRSCVKWLRPAPG